MNEQFETQNPVENTVTPARKETKPPLLQAWQQQWLSRAALAYLQRSKQELF